MSFFEFPHTRTYDSDLGWLITHVNSYDEVIAALNDWIAEYTPTIEDLQTLYDELQSGELPPGVQQGINDYLRDHAPDIVGMLAVQMIFFEIDDNGYFIAYIPESWDELIFNTTGYDINIAGYDFGHLVLSY